MLQIKFFLVRVWDNANYVSKHDFWFRSSFLQNSAFKISKNAFFVCFLLPSGVYSKQFEFICNFSNVRFIIRSISLLQTSKLFFGKNSVHYTLRICMQFLIFWVPSLKSSHIFVAIKDIWKTQIKSSDSECNLEGRQLFSIMR